MTTIHKHEFYPVNYSNSEESLDSWLCPCGFALRYVREANSKLLSLQASKNPIINFDKEKQ